MSLWGEILFIIASYLLGAIPFGYIFTKQATVKTSGIMVVVTLDQQM